MTLRTISNPPVHPVASNVFVDWHESFPGVLRLTIALVMLVVAVAVAGRRILWLVKLVRSRQPDHSRTREPREHA